MIIASHALLHLRLMIIALLGLVINSSLAVTADPNNTWRKFESGSSPTVTPQLRGGAASTLSPAALIYYCAKENNINPVGRLYYSSSTTLCCAHSLSEPVGLALGAQAGESRLAKVFAEAGYRHFRRALATPFNLILEARV